MVWRMRYFHSVLKSGLIVMLTLYLDESYSHPPAPLVYTVAGYIATDKKWRKFHKEWRRNWIGRG